ncbi:MAG TPA: DUF1071 domain-containing protein [Rhodanobacteraceae bacterium]
MSKSFIDGIRTPFKQYVRRREVKTKKGPVVTHHIPWAAGIALADRPQQTILRPERSSFAWPVFGGLAVGVSQKVGEHDQATWLPVLDGANRAIPAARATCRDISDTLQRCRAKAVAMVQGVALPLYAHGAVTSKQPNGFTRREPAVYTEDVAAFLRHLRVKPDSDLSTVDPVVNSEDEKNGDFIDWADALAAVRTTDPDFHWEVEFGEVIDTDTGEVGQRPYFQLGIGYAVAVDVTYKGIMHTELLPIMGFADTETKHGIKKLDFQPLVNPTAHDWNRSVMRCLTKAIAVVSGYGLGLYAKADTEVMHVEALTPRHKAEAPEQEVPKAETPAAAPEDPEVKAKLIADVQAAVSGAGRQIGAMMVWLGHPAETELTALTVAELQRASHALQHAATAAA